MDWSSENLAHPFWTCLKKEESLLKHNELDHCHSYGYPSMPDLGPFLPNIPVSLQASTWDSCPPHPVPLFGHAPPHPVPPPSEWPMPLLSQTFTYTNTPSISTQLFFFFNPSVWGHLNPSSYCDVGRLFYCVFKLWSKLCRSLFKIM
jgi:hypothetical protein